MNYRLSETQEYDFLSLPETGMGYQIVEGKKQGSYQIEKFIVLNSEIVVEMNSYAEGHIRYIVNEGISKIKASASQIILSAYSVLSANENKNNVSEQGNNKGALENSVEYADGEEVFVRLSAFLNDKRVDRENRCLRPGSFTTTEIDYKVCKFYSYDPVERYALPNNDEIKWAFYIKPVKKDTLQRGTVQPANGKSGGGKEAYFANGTLKGTFIKQTEY
jgi:hypothetical protein